MKNKKRNTIITCAVVGGILLIAIIFFFLNNSIVDNGLSVLEKKWITDHSNQVVDVETYNDIPVYGYSGSGVIFDFLDYFTTKYNVSFNKISYYTTNKKGDISFGFREIKNNESLGEHDILFDYDNYSLISNKEDIVRDINSIEKIGILDSDKELLGNYFGEDKVTTYKNLQSLMDAIKSGEINYGSVLTLKSMSKIISNNLNIVYHINDIKSKYVLSVKDNTLYNIMKKTYSEYRDKAFKEDYSKNYLALYFSASNTDDVSRKNYNSKIYRYGYVVNMPFENNYDSSFVGTISNYITDFQDVSYSEIESVKFNTVDELKSALVSGDIDFALGNFDYSKINMEYMTSSSIRDLEYVVLSKDDYVINSIKGINRDVSLVNGSLLNSYCKDNKVSVKGFANTDEVIRNLNNDSVVIMDKETYLYYKNSSLKNYNVILDGNTGYGYKFIMNKSNKTFNSLFSYYISSVSYDSFKYKYHTNVQLYRDFTSLKIFLFSIALVLVLAASIFYLNKKSVVKTVSKKEDKLKYIDSLTSLKNRNYLNRNIYDWDDNVIFPQGIIVFDLDHIKRVNDKFGREAGDEIIRQAASILINNQIENTDIIRSDGDEFIIYMVGYDEKKVKEYMVKIQKLMKEIPKCLGVEAGYSMIFDEIKTVDDAINEAIGMMMKGKEDL